MVRDTVVANASFPMETITMEFGPKVSLGQLEDSSKEMETFMKVRLRTESLMDEG